MWRAHSAISSAAADENNWDAPVTLMPPVVDEIMNMTRHLMQNDPIIISPASKSPSTENNDYEALIYVDASSSGYGAYVALRGGTIFQVQGGWSGVVKHSAHAEPRAARTVLNWLNRTHPGIRHVAVITDHLPMASAQRRWHNHNSGFSSAWPLNDFFATLYSGAYPHDRREVYFVSGEQNIADALSRSNRIGDGLRAAVVSNIALDGLSCFWHPYANAPERPAWQT
jgi:hypothetical protein